MTYAVIVNKDYEPGSRLARQYYAIDEAVLPPSDVDPARVMASGLSLNDAIHLRRFLEEIKDD